MLFVSIVVSVEINRRHYFRYGLRILVVGRDGSVGTAAHYGLEGPVIESRWGARFSSHVHSGPVTHPTSYTKVTEAFPRVKRPGRGADHPPYLASGLKKEKSYTSTPHLDRRGLF